MAKDLIIKQTADTPAVIFRPKKGVFQIAGIVWPENPVKFFEPIIKWIKNYFDNKPLPETVFDFRLSYFNTAAAKQIIKLFKLLKQLGNQHKIKIIWYHHPDDDDMKQEGEKMKTIVGFDDEQFQILSTPFIPKL